MFELIETLQNAAPAWLGVLGDVAVKGTVLLVAGGAAVAAMRKASAAARQLVWTLTLAAMLTLPALSAALPAWRVLPDWARLEVPAGKTEPAPPPTAKAQAPVVANLPPSADAGLAGAPIAPAPAPVPASVPAAATPPSASPAGAGLWERVSFWAVLVWVAGAAACLAPLVIGRWSLWRLARASRRITDGPWAELVAAASEAVGLRRPVRLYASAAEPMPMVWGVLRAKLLIPAQAETWSRDRRRVVLLHELAHAKRHDCLTKLIAHAACAVYWFNPLCWLAFKRMQTEAEAACDDRVIAAGSRPSAYATHLLEIASGLRAGMLAAYSSIAMARRPNLEGRLLAILDAGRSRAGLTRRIVLAALAAVAAVAVPLSITRCQSPTSPALKAVAAWAKQRRWAASDIKRTTLESSLGGWRNLPFAISEAEEADVQACVKLAKKVHARRNDKCLFNEDETRDALEAVLARRKDWFYAEFLLGLWHRNRGELKKSREYLEKAYRHAPVIAVQRYEDEAGRPVGGISIEVLELECNRLQRGSLDPSLHLYYPDLRTDEAGCAYLPAYDTVFRRASAAHPTGYDTSYSRLGWFECPKKVGLLPVCTLSPHPATTAREVAEKFLVAMRDKDPKTMQALSLGTEVGWISDEKLAEMPFQAVPGLNMGRLKKGLDEFHKEAYPGRHEALAQIKQFLVQGEFAAAGLPEAKGQRYAIVIFTRTRAGWRFLYWDDATGPLDVALDRHAKRLTEMLSAVERIPGRSGVSPAAGLHIVADPEAAIRKALPPGWVIQHVRRNASPFYLEPGKGTAYEIGKPLDTIDPAKVKQPYQIILWVMPANYAGRSTSTDPHHQTVTPGLVSSADNGKVYAWPGGVPRALALVNAIAPLPEKVLEQRRRLLGRADRELRAGLLKLAETYPQLKQTNRGSLEQRLEGRSSPGQLRVGVGRFPAGPGKSAGVREDVPKAEQYSLRVILKPVGGPAEQLSTWSQYVHLRLEGMVTATAGDPKLQAALKVLLAQALGPLAALDRGLAAPPTPAVARDARQVAEAFLAAVIAGKDREAIRLTDPASAVGQQVKEFRQLPNLANMKIVRVQADDKAALAETTPTPADRGRMGLLMLTLTRSRGLWVVSDIDYETPESAKEEREAFLERHPRAVEIPAPADGRNARQVAEAFLAAAVAGREEEAIRLTDPANETRMRNDVREFRGADMAKLKIFRVQADDKAALAEMTATVDDQGRDGVLILFLIRSRGRWAVRGMVFVRPPASIEDTRKEFLERHPRAVEIPTSPAPVK